MKAAAAPAQCSLSGLNADTNGIIRRSRDNGYCYYYNENTGVEVSGDCSDNVFSDLNNGEWAVTFSYGTVKGTAKCSSTSGTFAQAGTPSDTDGKYYWCQATTYTPNGDDQCTNVSPVWVFNRSFFADSIAQCNVRVASRCVNYVQSDSGFRRALFGLSN